MAAKMYAWSDLYGGGEIDEISLPKGGTKTVVVSRNIVPRGDAITRAKLGVSEEEWDHLVESGSIRPYPLPEGADDVKSPTRAVLEQFSKGGDIDQDMLLSLALQQPLPINGPAEEGAEVDLPEGA